MKSHIGTTRNTYSVFLTLRTCEPWGLVRLGKRNTLCDKNGMQIFFFWFHDFLFCCLLYFMC